MRVPLAESSCSHIRETKVPRKCCLFGVTVEAQGPGRIAPSVSCIEGGKVNETFSGGANL